MSESTQVKHTPRISLVVGLLSGPAIYMIHFLVVYFLVEAGCSSGLYRSQWFGYGAVNVLVVIITLVAAAATAFFTWLSVRRWRRSRRATGEELDSYSGFLSFAGIGLNGYCTLVILLTGLPTLTLVMCEWI